jgi:hypothetical protein
VASAAPGQELTGIFNINYPADGTQAPRLRFFKQQLPAIGQQLSAIRSLASVIIYKIYEISLACEQET